MSLIHKQINQTKPIIRINHNLEYIFKYVKFVFCCFTFEWKVCGIMYVATYHHNIIITTKIYFQKLLQIKFEYSFENNFPWRKAWLKMKSFTVTRCSLETMIQRLFYCVAHTNFNYISLESWAESATIKLSITESFQNIFLDEEINKPQQKLHTFCYCHHIISQYWHA